MIRGVMFSRTQAALGAAGLAGALVMALVHHALGERRSRWLQEAQERENEVAALIAACGGSDAASLEALRDRVRGFRTRLGPTDTWDRILAQLGAGWRGEPGSREDRGGYAFQEAALSLRSPTTSDWPEILGAVGALEHTPGVSVVGFEMDTSGDRLRRSVDRVKVTVALQTTRETPAPPSP